MAYNDEQIEKIFNSTLKRIEDGEPLRQILREKEMPSTSTFYIWLEEIEGFSKRYARSCDLRAETLFDDIIEIADDSKRDFEDKDVGDGITFSTFNSEHVQRSRLRIDARKWVVSKLNPKKYGDKLDMTSGGDKITQTPIFGDNPLDRKE